MATIPVSFRLPEKNHLDFSQKAAQADMTLTDFLKEAIINNKSIVMKREKEDKDKQHLLFLFSKTSNNLNQLAHRAHIDNQRGVLSMRHYQQLTAQLNCDSF